MGSHARTFSLSQDQHCKKKLVNVLAYRRSCHSAVPWNPPKLLTVRNQVAVACFARAVSTPKNSVRHPQKLTVPLALTCFLCLHYWRRIIQLYQPSILGDI